MPDPSPTTPYPDESAAFADMPDPLAILDELIELTETHISDFERQRQPDQLTPRQVELAIIHTITGAIRTTNQLAHLLEEADKAPHSHAFDDAIAHFSASITHAETRLRELEAHRRLEQIPWLPRERLLLRYGAVLERLRLAQARLRRRTEIHQERQRQRALTTQQRTITRGPLEIDPEYQPAAWPSLNDHRPSAKPLHYNTTPIANP